MDVRGGVGAGHRLLGWFGRSVVAWQQVTAAASWSARDLPGVVVFGDDLWQMSATSSGP